jgi:hypothetical protein
MRNQERDPKPESAQCHPSESASGSSNLGPSIRCLEELMREVRTLKRGGDLEGLLEKAAMEIKQELYQAATRERTQAAAEAAFPPSAMRAVSAGDASLREIAAPDQDPGRGGGV